MTDTDSWNENRQPLQAIDRIGHELRTPLTVVIGMCELLHDDLPNDNDLKELASRMAANAWLLHTVIERLIDDLYQAGYTGPAEPEIHRADIISPCPAQSP